MENTENSTVSYIASGADLKAVADAIRSKGGTSANLSFPSGFVTAIGNISTGFGFPDTYFKTGITIERKEE